MESRVESTKAAAAYINLQKDYKETAGKHFVGICL